jgi:hypothetical protein
LQGLPRPFVELTRHWSSSAAMAHYLHEDDEAKQDAQMKRLKRRARQAKQAKAK